jgi:hypothetical protein
VFTESVLAKFKVKRMRKRAMQVSHYANPHGAPWVMV